MARSPHYPCIYGIRNRLDGYIYIGSTVNPWLRWLAHCARLRNGQHHCTALQDAWDHDGAGVFEHVVLESLPTYHALHRAETVWIRRFLASGHVYNTILNADTRGCVDVARK